MMNLVNARLRGLLTRGKVIASALNPKRTLLQVSGLNGETKDELELFQTLGRSSLPKAGADVLLLQIGGSSAHTIALFADDGALRIQDLQPGEFGDRDYNGQQIVFRGDHIEITTPSGKNIVVNCGGDLTATVSGDLSANVTGDSDLTVGGKATVDVTGDADITVGGDVSANITGDLDATIGGAVTATAASWTLNGAFHVNGNISATGYIHDHSSS